MYECLYASSSFFCLLSLFLFDEQGFEIKRRGELKLIKLFQGEVFKRFLDGDSLESCYASVSESADQWLDILLSKGLSMDAIEVLDLITESSNMSRSLEEYEGRKSAAITCARRLAELLGPGVIRDTAGLNCSFVISRVSHRQSFMIEAIRVCFSVLF